MPHALAFLRDVGLLLGVAAALLAPLYLFLRVRLRRAAARGEAGRYVPLTDPWIPVVIAMSGAGLVALLNALR